MTPGSNFPEPSENRIAFADRFNLGIDLRFHFIFPIPVQSVQRQSTLLGFTSDVMDSIECLERILLLPEHPREISERRERVIGRRMAGATYLLYPIPLIALPHLTFHERSPLVCFITTGATHDSVLNFRMKMSRPTLHASTLESPGTIRLSELSSNHLCTFVEQVRASYKSKESTPTIKALDAITLGQRQWDRKPLQISQFKHFSVLPNELVLDSFHFGFKGEAHLAGYNNDPYIDAIVKSVDAIFRERESVSRKFRAIAPQPLTLILTTPGFFKHVYGRVQVPIGQLRAAVKTFKAYTRQTGYTFHITGDEVLEIYQSEAAQHVIRMYQDEIRAYSLCVAAKACNYFAPAIRLPPAVNRLASELDKIARNARSNCPHIEFKQNKLMRQLKEALRRRVPEQFFSRIDRPGSVIKLIADAPLEWIPIRGLPLMLRYDTSRIPTTPGNLLFELCVSPGEIIVSTDFVQDILIVRSYSNEDPIKTLLSVAISTFPLRNLRLRIVDVETEDQFVAAFQAFGGGIAIFDGHGSPATLNRPGRLIVGGSPLNVWELRGRLRVPPIVILSSCDTHSLDGTHASVANSFLLLGAKSVFGTVLPIDARHAAVFLARLLYRLDEYLPSLTAKQDRPVRWINIMAGLQRMTYVTELLQFLERSRILLPTLDDRLRLATAANWRVVAGSEQWFEEITDLFAAQAGIAPCEMASLIGERFNFPEVLKYVQLGNPDQILVASKSSEHTIFGEPG